MIWRVGLAVLFLVGYPMLLTWLLMIDMAVDHENGKDV